MSLADENDLRSTAWNKALEACATQAIFAKRANRIRWLNNSKDFLGLFVPAAVGIAAMSIEFSPSYFRILISLTAIPLIAQLALSIWSLVAKWNDAYISYVESILANNSLRRKWEDFGRGIVEINRPNFNQLMELNTDQERIDLAKGVNEKEKRYGMRYGLREYQKSCVECKTVPNSLKPSKCNTCGKF